MRSRSSAAARSRRSGRSRSDLRRSAREYRLFTILRIHDILASVSRAAELLRRVRQQSGLTQSALAQLADIPQSVISEYENGRREPSFDAVDRLSAAAGFVIDFSGRPDTASSTLDRVRASASALHRSLEPLGARRIRLFGSVARGEDSETSDIDLVVDIDPETGIFDLLRMQREAEAILGRQVDLVPSNGLKPAVIESVERDSIEL